MADPPEPLDARIKSLRSEISDLSHEIDSHKAKTAGAIGAGVFLFLLAALAGYDIVSGKSGVWSHVGITAEILKWIAIGLGSAAILLCAVAFIRVKRRNLDRDYRLELMEEEYAELLDEQSDLGRSRDTEPARNKDRP